MSETTNAYLSDDVIDFVSNFDFVESNLSFSDFPSVFGPSTPTTTAQAVRETPATGGQEVLLEPRPIAHQGVVVVEQLPVAATPWNVDSTFLDSLRMILKEPSNLASHQRLAQLSCGDKLSLKGSFSQPYGMHENTPTKIISLDPSTTTTSKSREEEVADTSSFRSSHVEQWNQRYKELQVYQKENGHCLVPLNWSKNPSLAHWVKRQRYQFRMKREGKHSTLTEERKQALESLGFVWDSHAAGWEERWNELREFKERHGHCNVPKKYPQNQPLAVWVKCQRRQFKLSSQGQNSTITRGRIEKLQQLGFVFDPRSRKRRMRASCV